LNIFQLRIVTLFSSENQGSYRKRDTFGALRNLRCADWRSLCAERRRPAHRIPSGPEILRR
jgi:hypothetical protein